MIVYHFIRDIDRSSGGPSFSVPSLCDALSQCSDIRVELIARRSEQPLLPAENPDLRCRLVDGTGRRKLREVFDRHPGGEPAVVHVNGLWDSFHHVAISEARRRRLPLIVSVRGMLEPSALGHKLWKKTAGWYLYQKQNLNAASAIHATSQSEVESIRRLGLTNPVALLANGISISDQTGFNRRKDPVILFLGRLHPIKALDVLLAAWAKAGTSGWTLQISGPDEDGHAVELREHAARLGIAESVRFTGPLEGQAKWDALAHAACLVLPSRSENFGMVVAEALSIGTPVAASTGTPWSELQEDRAGWWIPSEPEAFAEVIRQVAGLPENELREMGRRGRELISRQYSWPALIGRYEKVYRWLAGDSPQPDDVLATPPE